MPQQGTAPQGFPETGFRWCADNFEQLHIRIWNEEVFIFNPGSGLTHILNEVALAILEALAQKPQTTDHLAAHYLAEDDPASLRVLIGQLEQLETIGLLRRLYTSRAD